MKELNIGNLRMIKQVMQQYRDLTLNGNKFFYYSYAKLDVKIQSVLKKRKEKYQDAEFVEVVMPLEITIDYTELKKLLKVKRIENELIDSIITNVSRNSSFVIRTEKETTLLFIYESIVFNSLNKNVRVKFTEDATNLFVKIREMPYSNIVFSDILNIKNKYQINFYLYAISILRGNAGKLRISIENIRKILGNYSQIDDYNFVHRFINKPAKEITENKDIKLKITTSRESNNILINVSKK